MFAVNKKANKNAHALRHAIQHFFCNPNFFQTKIFCDPKCVPENIFSPPKLFPTEFISDTIFFITNISLSRHLTKTLLMDKGFEQCPRTEYPISNFPVKVYNIVIHLFHYVRISYLLNIIGLESNIRKTFTSVSQHI